MNKAKLLFKKDNEQLYLSWCFIVRNQAFVVYLINKHCLNYILPALLSVNLFMLLRMKGWNCFKIKFVKIGSFSWHRCQVEWKWQNWNLANALEEFFVCVSSVCLKGAVMQIEKSTDKWLLRCFKSILKFRIRTIYNFAVIYRDFWDFLKKLPTF